MNCKKCGRFVKCLDSFSIRRTGYAKLKCENCDDIFNTKTWWTLEVWGEMEPTTVLISDKTYNRDKEYKYANR